MPIPAAQSVQPITRYIEDTRFDPSRNRRLTAPPFLQLDLESGSPTSSVKYFLTKMDFRRELNRTFWGRDVIYADIDGGEAWSRKKRIELVIADHEKPMSISVDAIEAATLKACG